MVHNFLGNYKNSDFAAIVLDMLGNYNKLGCQMSVKLHFLHSHLDLFTDNLGDVNKEEAERFHQNIKDIKMRYQGRWDVSMLADYCWLLTRDGVPAQHNRKRVKCAFLPK